jgi:hypothetical protein
MMQHSLTPARLLAGNKAAQPQYARKSPSLEKNKTFGKSLLQAGKPNSQGTTISHATFPFHAAAKAALPPARASHAGGNQTGVGFMITATQHDDHPQDSFRRCP